MKKEISITISIPAFNEEQTLESVVKEALHVLRSLTDDYELLLINDGSTDSTEKIMNRLARKDKHIRVIHHKVNMGFCSVYKEGLLGASKDLVFLAPADGQFRFKELEKFVRAMKGHDVVVAYRTVNAESFTRKLQSFIYCLLAKILFGIRLREFSTVAMWRTSILSGITIVSNPGSNTAQVEFVYKVLKRGGRFAEIPIHWDKRRGGRPKGTININLIWLTFHQMLKLFFKERFQFNLNPKILSLTFIFCIAWELFAFVQFPKQAWVQGLTEAWFVSEGLFFYRDFLGTYTPFLRVAMIPFHNIFGFNQQTTILLYPVTSIATLCLLFFASIKWLKGVSRYLPILFFTLWNQYLTGNHFTTPTFLGFICLLTFILWKSWLDKKNISKAFFIGVLSGIGVLSMQILIPFTGVVYLSILLLSLNEKIGLKYVLSATFGFLAVAAPILLWLVSSSIFNDFYYWTVKYHFIDYPYTGFGRSFNDTLVFLAVHSPLLLLLGLLYLKKNNLKETYFSVFFILTLLSLTIPTWFAIFHPIRFQMTLPLLALALGYGVSKLYFLVNRQIIIQLSILVLIFILNIVVWIKVVPSNIERSLKYPSAKHIISKFYPDDPMYGAIAWIQNNTSKKSKLFVIGDVLFYFESKRLPSSIRATTNIPIVYKPKEDLIKELRETPPDYWVIDERQWRRFEDFGFGDTATFLKNLLLCDTLLEKIEYVSLYKREPKEEQCLK